MPRALQIVFAAILLLTVPVSAAEPPRVGDPDAFCEEVVHTIANKAPREAAELVANAIGQPDATSALMRALQIFEGNKIDYSKKVIDKEYNGALRQLVYYSYIENTGFLYFRFNFKMTSTGWILAHFTFKDETNELFPKDFIER